MEWLSKNPGGPAYALCALRVMSALLFMQHGLQKMLHFPDAGHHTEPFNPFSLTGVAGILEVVGGLLLAVGLRTRVVAFILSGEMAVGYFGFHLAAGMSMPRGFFPVVNGGDLAILFCFVFFYLSIEGPGAFGLDGYLSKSRDLKDRGA